MGLFQVIAEIEGYPEGSGNKSKKMVYAEDAAEAINKFYEKIDRPGNIDKTKYTIIAVENQEPGGNQGENINIELTREEYNHLLVATDLFNRYFIPGPGIKKEQEIKFYQIRDKLLNVLDKENRPAESQPAGA